MNIFEKRIKQNKLSPIYPNLGVYMKACFTYKQVTDKAKKTDLDGKN